MLIEQIICRVQWPNIPAKVKTWYFIATPVDAGLFFKSFFYIAVIYLKNIII